MLDTQNQGPQCTACGSSMKLTAIEPSAPGQDLRTFTCPQCKRVQRLFPEAHTKSLRSNIRIPEAAGTLQPDREGC
jgi:hypothetical protein